MNEDIAAAIDKLERVRERMGYLAAIGAGEQRIAQVQTEARVAHKDLVDAINRTVQSSGEKQYEAGIEMGRASAGD